VNEQYLRRGVFEMNTKGACSCGPPAYNNILSYCGKLEALESESQEGSFRRVG
jgi:hypothetical protein